jgi:subtilisin-like proprotein convertase family protein
MSYSRILHFILFSSKIGIGATVEVYLDIEACVNITMLEHVVANISYSFHRRGDVKITIISPSKTPSEMLSYRKNDATDQGIKYFPFISAHHWGESVIGRWILRIETRKPENPESERSAANNEDLGELGHFGLRFFGTHRPEDKTNQEQAKRSQSNAFVPTQREIESIYKRELSVRETPNVVQKRDYQNLMKERRIHQQNGDENLVEEHRSVFGLFRRAFGF